MICEAEIIVEHRYVVRIAGDNEQDAAYKALAFVMDNESHLVPEDYDGRIENVKEVRKNNKGIHLPA